MHSLISNRHRLAFVTLAFCLFHSGLAFADCHEKGILIGTNYFVPRQEIPSTYSMYSSFRQAVRVEGSGILKNGNILRYNGRVDKRVCEKIKGEWTVPGQARRCLIPFVSIAADNDYYPPGTIIAIKELRGEKIVVTNDGQIYEHPGFFIVDDIGGAINGKGRFDFFSGALAENNRANAFGYYGKFSMSPQRCDKHYKAIFFDKKPDSDYQKALKAIEDSTDVAIAGKGKFGARND